MSTNHENRQAGQVPQGKSEMGTERIPGQTNGGHQKLGSFPH